MLTHREPFILFVLLAVEATTCVSLGGCALASGTNGIVPAQSQSDWQPVLSDSQVSEVRQTFPLFAPELFAPGTSVTSSNLGSTNFSPALFFGPKNPQGFKTTPLGIMLETNGFDGAQMPSQLPANGVYFNRQGEPLQFNLSTFTRSPQNILENYLGVPQTPGAPVMTVDLSAARIDPAYVDQFMVTLRDQLALALPAIQNADPRNCQIVIEPTIFYVSGGNYPDGYAGGLTEPLGNYKLRIHVQAFYISSSQRISNWQDYLIDEGLNCYVASVGRPDLQR